MIKMSKLNYQNHFLLYLTFLLIFLLSFINCQENAQLRVAKSLEECYRNDYLLQRDNRLPMTITTLIQLIQKIENTPGYNQDIKQTTISLLHRFRQDGIIEAQGVKKSPSILPYSPRDFQFSKHRILLSRLIPGNALNFPNDTLTANERCSLHFMLSSTFEKRVRGDERERCSQLSQYRSQRLPRNLENRQPKSGKDNNFIGDVEILETLNSKILTKPSSQNNGKMQLNDTQLPFDVEFETNYDSGVIDIASDAVSQCPVESGVIWTPWGTVSAGTVLAGIAAGLEPQKVQLRTLLAFSKRQNFDRNDRQYNVVVDNKWAATLAGDLAEITLIQAPESTSKGFSIGAPGIWNSTAIPRWYFLTKREKLEMTDAEIRGGLDGLIIAKKIKDWKNNNLKLSQLLQMYYSHAGVLDSGVKACNRKALFAEVAPLEEMKVQATTFAIVLNKEIALRVTLEEEAISSYASRAADALAAYVPQSLDDLSCEATMPTPNDPTTVQVATDLYIFVDTTWQHRDIQPILGYVLERVNINKYGSRVTIMNANDCKTIVNTTNSGPEVFQIWNVTTQQQHPYGFNLPNILRKLQNLTTTLMDEEKRNSSSGGRSLIALIVTSMGSVNEGDTNFAIERIKILREEVPDLKILFMANGAVTRFSQFVKDPSKDLFTARQGGDNIPTQAKPVLKRIQEIPRRIINHRCGSNWYTTEYGQSQMNQYVSPGSVNYYRLHPNYFYGSSENRKLRFQGQGSIGLTICSSRKIELPRSNTTQQNKEDIDCRQLVSDAYEINLNNPCDGYSYIHDCPSFYISAEVSRSRGSSQTPCSDPECVRPDQIKFIVQHENLGCFSGCGKNVLSFSVLIITVFYHIIARR